MPDILPDVLAPGLRLVVCGSAAGDRSAAAGAYYAGPGNRFWITLHRIGLTPTLLRPPEFPRLIAHGIGLTDIVKTRSGADAVLRASDFDRAGLLGRIERHRPSLLVFNGKKAAEAFLGGRVGYGCQHGRDIGTTKIHVAPSTSGAARGFWNEDIWRDIADAVRVLDRGSTPNWGSTPKWGSTPNLDSTPDQGSTIDMILPSSDNGR
jgi:TDG/mug DNA glycosylase family protein